MPRDMPLLGELHALRMLVAAPCLLPKPPLLPHALRPLEAAPRPLLKLLLLPKPLLRL